MLILASCFRISADRYEVLAIPAEEKLSWPGFSFASAMKSFSVLPGKSGGTIATSGTAATRDDAGEILHRIELDVLVDGAGDRVPVRGQHQRVAIRRALGDRRGSREARPVFDDHLLLPQLAELVGENASEPVGDAAGGERNDDADDLVGIGLGRCVERGAKGRGRHRRQGQQGRAKSRHRSPPEIVGAPLHWVAVFWEAIKAGSQFRVYE